ncbi:hypothetical protein B0H11DRAFT_2371520 [Mycena galericulata]|nr:hypothetical protein B0H11DRAFT_2371520 [Mycena galericulata]
MVPLPPLPCDLLGPILSHINDNSSILALCLVSRIFFHEAQRRLYADIVLKSPAVYFFCRTISESPSIGTCVRRLSIQVSADPILGQVAKALHSLPSLRALEITHPQPHHWARMAFIWPGFSPRPRRFSAHILHDCPFRLKKFSSAFRMADPAFIAFLGQQPEIEELISSDIGDSLVLRLPAAFLPRLRMFRSAVTRLEFQYETNTDPLRTVERQEMMDAEFYGVEAFRQRSTM